MVGFDDIHLAQFMLPPLTTVQMSCKDLAAAAVEALRAGIEPGHPEAAQREWPIQTRLVVRRSTDFPRGTLPALGKGAVHAEARPGAKRKISPLKARIHCARLWPYPLYCLTR